LEGGEEEDDVKSVETDHQKEGKQKIKIKERRYQERQKEQV